MKERPILFTGPMVRAILDRRKTQTRRVVKPQPTWSESGQRWGWSSKDGCHSFIWPNERGYPVHAGMPKCCPYGVPGDRLWVRETWGWHRDFDPHKTQLGHGLLAWKAGSSGCPDTLIAGWKPSIFMPRWASRITMEIVSVRVQRVQEITENDAKAEGIVTGPVGLWSGCSESDAHGAVAQYRKLWDSINAKRGFGWGVNPWVWAIEFKRITP